MHIPALRRVLLGLIGTAEAPDLTGTSKDDWLRLDAMAEQHRLQPMLHVRQAGNADVPAEVKAGWREAHRYGAMMALVQRAELAECCALLETKGFTPVALKGAYLAWHAYPEATQRPLRDLDLLVELHEVEAAWQALRSAGYAMAYQPDMAIADIVRLDKHLPVLIAPRGTNIELHHRMWEPDGAVDHATPAPGEAATRARAVRLGGICYPCPQDMLVHLIVHALYSHKLDCGPLVLTDLAHLISREEIDWDVFWRRGQHEGWDQGAGLLFALVRRWHGASAAPPPPMELPESVIDSAPDLLLQNLDTKRSAGVVSTALAAGPAALIRRLVGKRAGADGDAVQRDLAGEGGFCGWAVSRLKRTAGELASRDVRRQSRDLARLSRWLNAGQG